MLSENDKELHRGLDDTYDVDGSVDKQFGPSLMVPDWHLLVYMREARDSARATLQAITLAWEEQWLKRTVAPWHPHRVLFASFASCEKIAGCRVGTCSTTRKDRRNRWSTGCKNVQRVRSCRQTLA